MPKLTHLLAFCLSGSLYAAPPSSDLSFLYDYSVNNPSDINQHVPLLKQLSKECQTVLMIGVRRMASTWGCLKGLSENSEKQSQYIGVDWITPPLENIVLAKILSEVNGITFKFFLGNDLKIDPPETDLLFIDSHHTYCHLTEELERFAPHTKKYIALHHTSPPYGYTDEPNIYNLPNEYSVWIDKNKQGLWPATEDFLTRHSDEWMLQERRFNNHGFTILKRISNKG